MKLHSIVEAKECSKESKDEVAPKDANKETKNVEEEKKENHPKTASGS